MLRIFPSTVLTWRSSSCVQFGVDDPTLIDGLGPADVAVVDRLREGISRSSLPPFADRLGTTVKRIEGLVELLREADVLEPESPVSGVRWQGAGNQLSAWAQAARVSPDEAALLLAETSVIVIGDVASALASTLQGQGFSATAVSDLDVDAIEEGATVVATSWHVPNPWHVDRLVAADITHLPLALGTTDAALGPLTRPGVEPCAMCSVRTSADRDPGYAEVFQQLLSNKGDLDTGDTLLWQAVAVQIGAALRTWIVARENVLSMRRRIELPLLLPRDEHVTFHPECDCRLPVAALAQRRADAGAGPL